MPHYPHASLGVGGACWRGVLLVNIILYGFMECIRGQIRTVYLGFRQAIQSLIHSLIGYFLSLGQGFSFYHFSYHTAGSNRGCTAESIKLYVFNNTVGYFNLDMHYITAHRIAYLANSAGQVNFANITWIHEMIHYFLAIH